MVKVNTVFIRSDEGDLEHRPWCKQCTRYYKYFDEPKTWSCDGCGKILDRRKARANKAIDTDTATPLVATRKGSKFEDKDMPGIQWRSLKQISRSTGEERDLL